MFDATEGNFYTLLSSQKHTKCLQIFSTCISEMELTIEG